MKTSIIVVLVLLTLTSACKQDSQSIKPLFLMGEVINPTSRFVTLGMPDKEQDTFYLDNNNFFKTKLSVKEEGLYYFTHGIERQLLYLQHGDSLTLRVNTVAFDESLAVGGKGSEKNSFLLDLYLNDEKQSASILSQVNIDPKKFVSNLETNKEKLLSILNILDSKVQLSQSFKSLATKLIEIQEYVNKERYAFLVYKLNPQNSKHLDATYFDFRDNLVFNDPDLKHTFLYYHFFDNYTLNKVMEAKYAENGYFPKTLDMYSFPFLQSRINLVEESTPFAYLRNKFFERYGKQGVILSNDTLVAQQTIELLAKKEFSKNLLQDLKNYKAIQSLFLPGQSIGNVNVITNNDQVKLLSELITKPSVVHSWSLDSYRHHFNSHKKIKKLQNEYPDIDFIGVNTDFVDLKNDPKRLDKWKKTIKTFNYDANKEFQMLSTKSLSNLLKAYKNKVLFVDKDSEIVIGATELNSSEFDQQFEQFKTLIAQGL